VDEVAFLSIQGVEADRVPIDQDAQRDLLLTDPLEQGLDLGGLSRSHPAVVDDREVEAQHGDQPPQLLQLVLCADGQKPLDLLVGTARGVGHRALPAVESGGYDALNAGRLQEGRWRGGAGGLDWAQASRQFLNCCRLH